MGSWRCGHKWGLGTFYYPDGTTYTGQWKRDLRHGHGVYTYQNADTYEGAWHKDRRHGIGVYNFKATGARFQGTWKQGVRQGPAEIAFDRHRFHGMWQVDRPIGPAVYTFACATMTTGFMTDMMEGMAATAVIGQPLWRAQRVIEYDFAKLPPEPMPLPVSDSEEDDCDVTPAPSEVTAMDFPAREEEEEEEGEVDVLGEEELEGDHGIEELVK